MKEAFRKAASKVSNAAGNASTFIAALTIVIIWALSGHLFNYSNTWQLVINTGTTIVTFLMVFLIQNTQNRDSRAVHLKLDELIRVGQARDSFIDIEDLSDDELHWLDNEFKKMHGEGEPHAAIIKLHKKIQKAHEKRRSGTKSTAGDIVDALNPFNRDKN